jgi:hypothetical protein
LLFAAIAVLIRTPVYLLSLLGSEVDGRGRLLIAWFGPRGLSSLLLVLLAVFAGVPGGDQLFAVCSLVVLVSVVLHGGSPMLLARGARKRALKEGPKSANDEAGTQPLPVEREVAEHSEGSEDEIPVCAEACPLASEDGNEEKSAIADGVASAEVSGRGDGVQVSSQSITIDELRRLWQAEEPVTILDVRTDRSIEGSDSQAKAAVRMPPDHVAERAMELGLKPLEWLVAYCT